ncbi:MAG: diguanylate cyclase [Rhodocyclales bacterium]|nr:diguanylate cyclase [Rhodocyclales bacterium]
MRWLTDTLRGRLLVGAVLPALVMVLLVEWAFFTRYQDDQEKLFQEYGQAIAHQFGSAVEYADFSGNHEPLRMLASGVMEGNPLVRSVSVLDQGGNLLVQSGPARQYTLALNGAPQVISDKHFTTVVVPVQGSPLALEEDAAVWERGTRPAAPRVAGHVVVELSRAHLDAREREMLQVTLAIMLTGLLLSGWLSFRIAAGVLGKLDAVAAELNRQKDAAEQLARTDALTGLANRRAFDEVAQREVQLAQRYDTPLTLILTDLDHFKTINDLFGHFGGDEVLKNFAQVLRASTRSVDLIGRWGGEEFVVLMPGTTLEEACHAAERMRLAAVDTPTQVDGKTCDYTASFGVVSFRAATPTLVDLICRADAALYRAKRNGRNRVESE